MKFSFNGKTAISIKEDYTKEVCGALIEGEVDKSVIRKMIISTINKNYANYVANRGQVLLVDGEAFTVHFTDTENINLSFVMTSQDFVYTRGRVVGYTDLFSKDLDNVVDALLNSYTIEELTRAFVTVSESLVDKPKDDDFLDSYEGRYWP